MTPFDDRACTLGEGPLWHPERNQLFWFDIKGKKLMTRMGENPSEWTFSEHVSAAGWVDDRRLLIASETRLFTFDLIDGAKRSVASLEADMPNTRSNDGRADPWGGFWIGTMSKTLDPGEGAIYRYYRGELRKLFGDISVSNAICFAPDRSCAYYTDTPTQQIMRVALDPASGWPNAEPKVHIDLTGTEFKPDGAVTDAEGNLWNAQWGAARVAQYGPNGSCLSAVEVPSSQATCPAFGGPDLGTMFCTSAAEGIDAAGRAARPKTGQTFAQPDLGPGLPEPRVIL